MHNSRTKAKGKMNLFMMQAPETGDKAKIDKIKERWPSGDYQRHIPARILKEKGTNLFSTELTDLIQQHILPETRVGFI